MSPDYMTELGYLGVTARIKRLSDMFSANIKELYMANGLDIEPSWHLVFLLLKEKKRITMSEIAVLLHLSQPATTKILSRMIRKGYVKSMHDKNDARKKNIQLTAKGEKNLPRFEKIWDIGQETIREMLQTNISFMTGLSELENEMYRISFSMRAMKKLEGKNE